MKRRDNLKQALKKWWMRTGQHGKTGRSLNLDNRSLNLENTSQAFDGRAAEVIGGSSPSSKEAPYIENDDPERKRIRMPRRVGRLERWFRHQKSFWSRELTPDEKHDLEVRRLENLMFRKRRADCMALNKLIPNSYASMGIEYVRLSRKKHEREKIERVQFSSWKWSIDGSTAYGKIRSLPYGHRPDELVRDEVLTGLSFSVGHPVGGRCDDKGGGILISVSLAGSLDMPTWVDYDQTFPLISESQPPLSVFLGIGENGSRHVFDLETLPHLLIGGATGSGKSVALTGIIATLAARNSPRDLRLLLADLKGVDLTLFENLPHLLSQEIEEIPSGIVTRENQIIPMFRWLQRENDRRAGLFGHEHIRSLGEWNRKHRSRHLERIVVCIDEFARLMRNEYERKEFISVVYDLSSTSRATGISMIIATQFCKDRFISTDIKLNFSGRLAFSVPDLQGSVSMIDSSEACNIFPPPGRCIFMAGVTKFRCQSPYISTRQILAIVRAARQGKTLKAIPADTGLTEAEILRWSLTENNGYLQTNSTFQHFTPRIEASNLKKLLQEMDEKVFTIDGVDYRVIPPAGGSRGRRVAKVELEEVA